jgi:hypothetical protein
LTPSLILRYLALFTVHSVIKKAVNNVNRDFHSLRTSVWTPARRPFMPKRDSVSRVLKLSAKAVQKINARNAYLRLTYSTILV